MSTWLAEVHCTLLKAAACALKLHADTSFQPDTVASALANAVATV